MHPQNFMACSKGSPTLSKQTYIVVRVRFNMFTFCTIVDRNSKIKRNLTSVLALHLIVSRSLGGRCHTFRELWSTSNQDLPFPLIPCRLLHPTSVNFQADTRYVCFALTHPSYPERVGKLSERNIYERWAGKRLHFWNKKLAHVT